MVIGLTGRSCAGKDEVASIFRQKGFYVIDEDHLGHVALDANLSKIHSSFPSAVVNGKVDRKILGKLVFSDPSNLARLEQISHPWMKEETSRLVKEGLERGEVVVINAAILVRLDLVSLCDEIVFVDAPFEIRARRAAIRDGIDEASFAKREANQKDIYPDFETFGKKIVKIINDHEKKQLYRQVEDYCGSIINRG